MYQQSVSVTELLVLAAAVALAAGYLYNKWFKKRGQCGGCSGCPSSKRNQCGK